MANEFDYSKWGAADWRQYLPADLDFGGQQITYGESAEYTPFTPATFSKNGYEFTVDPVSQYVTQIKKDGQRLNIVGGAEHTRYTGAGLLDPRLNEALANWKTTPDKLDDYLASMDPITAAGLLGTINDRGTVAAGSADKTAFRPETYWGQLMGDPTAQAWWNSNMTPAAQSAADEGPSFMDDLFTNIIPGVLAVFGGVNAMGGLAGLGEAGAISAADASAAMGSGVDAAGWGSGALDVLGAAETAGAGAYPWLDTAGNLDVTKFLEMTGPGGEYASAIPGGAEGIAGMDTLGSTSWLESAVNSLKHGDTSWLTSSVSPTQIKSVLSKALGGGSTPTKTGTAKTAASAAGGAGGINIFNTGGDDSGLADAMKIFSGGRSGMDSVVQAMSQSGKGN